MPEPRSLFTFPIHLGLGATALPQPAFTRMDWYEAYGARAAADGVAGAARALFITAGEGTRRRPRRAFRRHHPTRRHG